MAYNDCVNFQPDTMIKSSHLQSEAQAQHESSHSLPATLPMVSRATALIALGIGGLVLVGWLLDNDTLKRLLPGFVAMNPLTALCFILSGATLILLLNAPHQHAHQRMARVIACLIFAVGLFKLLEIIFGFPLGIDRVLFRSKLDVEAAAGFPNRMAPNTALNFLLLGLALLLVDARWGKRFWPTQIIAIVGACASLLALVGYAYGTKAFYGVGSFIPMALHTALTFLLLLTGLLFARPTRGLMVPIISAGAGGAMGRLLLPAAIIIPFLLGWLRLIGGEAELFAPAVGDSLFVVLNMLIFAILVWWNAGALYRADELRRVAEAGRRQAAEELEISHAEMSKRNAEMEADLNLAREIQQAFLPQQYLSFPRVALPLEGALQFHHRYQPTSTLGGDFTDILVLSETKAGIFICDVMGHGVRSALVTAVARGLMEELLPSASEPGRFLTQLNHSLMAILQRTRTPMFASAFFMVADVENRTMRFANAGHPSPLHLRREMGVVEPLCHALDCAGPALGVMDGFEYSTRECDLAKGDLIMLFTDGLFEVSRGNDEYGEERLLEAVSKRIAMSATPLFDELLSEIQLFADNENFEDDVCLVGMEVMRAGVETN